MSRCPNLSYVGEQGGVMIYWCSYCGSLQEDFGTHVEPLKIPEQVSGGWMFCPGSPEEARYLHAREMVRQGRGHESAEKGEEK